MLDKIVDWMLYSVCGLDSSLRWVGSLNFFIYDSIKILLLLFVMITIIGFFRTYLPKDKVKRWLSHKGFGLSNLVASMFGAATPFCSCSSIPLFLSFLKAGVPLGVTFSFLITSPLVNEYLVVLMLGFFGWKIALTYVVSGILIGVVSGLVLGRMKLERYLVKDLIASKVAKEEIFGSIKQRVVFGLGEALSIIKKLWLWILVGVGIGAIIHNYVPSEFIQSIINKAGVFSVPIAVILGVPMYGSSAAIVPIAVVLFQKGVPLGTALAFMMAIAALSFPEAVILRRAMELRLIAIFFAVVAVAIVLTGYIFNLLNQFI
ncbi:hypothetical protein COV93_02385 [Candidatus Woesearchaeota archaeon CG11_big_fil_rev_8_21_14_0_20_43_8]|nr:MAG: hypothetical protein COV93_02385 [Candidatus Woesearchaeota archaeon CG11_big_fil_rev_8_21_14_0_20_43_8]PIO06902.1 MAG: hypothetical protein COT47_02345 [Candidatus Woesearchaeota archaeon CG08_land_8_20_14_0_20_43_7]